MAHPLYDDLGQLQLDDGHCERKYYPDFLAKRYSRNFKLTQCVLLVARNKTESSSQPLGMTYDCCNKMTVIVKGNIILNGSPRYGPLGT